MCLTCNVVGWPICVTIASAIHGLHCWGGMEKTERNYPSVVPPTWWCTFFAVTSCTVLRACAVDSRRPVHYSPSFVCSVDETPRHWCNLHGRNFLVQRSNICGISIDVQSQKRSWGRLVKLNHWNHRCLTCFHLDNLCHMKYREIIRGE